MGSKDTSSKGQLLSAIRQYAMLMQYGPNLNDDEFHKMWKTKYKPQFEEMIDDLSVTNQQDIDSSTRPFEGK